MEDQGCIFFPWFLYPSLFILWWNYIYFIILGGVHNYETFLLLICFIIFQKSSKSCKIFTILLLICLIFLISFPVLSKVLIDLGHIYGPNRKNIHPWGWPMIIFDIKDETFLQLSRQELSISSLLDTLLLNIRAKEDHLGHQRMTLSSKSSVRNPQQSSSSEDSLTHF